eukprot:TRINITY_DN30276_c0_g1_i1.p1 TRINITY_DN30276_c0_g1~~TRINITY_DN30276_c0_g1_i1.p1  ORF type:complete len:487 (+),score=200.90 TRINITY_DN30276_c0_g1_i1:77-1537(+)
MKSLRLLSTQSLLDRDFEEDGATKISLKSLLRRTDPRNNDLICGPKPTFIDCVKEKTDKLAALMKLLGQNHQEVEDLRFRPGGMLEEMDRLIDDKQRQLVEMESRATKAKEEQSAQVLCPDYVAGVCADAQCALSHGSDLVAKWADEFVDDAVDEEGGIARLVAPMGKQALHEVLLKLGSNERVPTLALHAVSKESTKALFRALPANTLRHVTSLNLSGNAFGVHNTSGLASLAMILKKDATLKTLILDDNQLGSKGLLTILRGFETPGGNTSVTTLSLQRNGVAHHPSDTRFEKICSVLKKNWSIKHLALGGNFLGGEVYADVLRENKHLRHLDLYGSDLGATFGADGAVPAWCEALKTTHVTSFDLRWNKLSASAVQAVLDALAENQKTERLALACNRVAATLSCAEFMKANPNLQHLDLRWIALPDDTVANLLEGLAACPHLAASTGLDISQNGLDQKLMDRVDKAVASAAGKEMKPRASKAL